MDSRRPTAASSRCTRPANSAIPAAAKQKKKRKLKKRSFDQVPSKLCREPQIKSVSFNCFKTTEISFTISFFFLFSLVFIFVLRSTGFNQTQGCFPALGIFKLGTKFLLRRQTRQLKMSYFGGNNKQRRSGGGAPLFLPVDREPQGPA